ncbi:hypothetical protein IWQ61_000059 [Dispira simplex]|nr:hypothetical protein IWQ61_000059 [Dispira simplex]
MQSNYGTNWRYELTVVQNPVRARMCGFGEKDRRPLDPPPVVRLDLYDEHNHRVENLSDVSNFVCMATIWSASGQSECSVVVNPSSVPSQPSFPRSSVISLSNPTYTRNLVGSAAVTGQYLTDLDHRSQIFFIFSDLAVRTEGRFTLKFTVTRLGGNGYGALEADSITQCSTMSDVFEVYSAKKFPGMTDSTELSRCLASQGVKIPIRKKSAGK